MSRPDRIDPRQRLDRFAELLSSDIPIPQIAERMGIGRGTAHDLLKKIRDELGDQAR